MDITTTDLTTLTAVELRKLGAALGVKGASKGKRAELLSAIGEIQVAQRAVKETPKIDKTKCMVCQKRSTSTAAQRRAEGIGNDFNDMCIPCYREGSWENTHSDFAHEDILSWAEEDRTEEQRETIAGCWICFPELNEAQHEYTPRKGNDRKGQVVVAKGTKAEVFKAAAEQAGWTVKIVAGHGYTRATATRDADLIDLGWVNGRSYDYPASSATLAGKSRKVRNLKEAIRLLG